MTKSKIRFVNLYKKLLSLSIHDKVISLAHGQVPNEISLARSEKALAPGVGQWDLSAPAIFFNQASFDHIRGNNYDCILSKGYAVLDL